MNNRFLLRFGQQDLAVVLHRRVLRHHAKLRERLEFIGVAGVA